MRRGIAVCAVLVVMLAVAPSLPTVGATDGVVSTGATAPAPPGAATTAEPGGPANDSGVRIVVRYPAGEDSRNETILTAEDFLTVGEVGEDRAGGIIVPVRLTEDGAREFVERLRATGIGVEDANNCRWEVREGYCMLLVSGGRVAHASDLDIELVRQVSSGTFVEFPVILFGADDEAEARSIRRALLGRPPASTTTGDAGGGGGGPLGGVPPWTLLVGAGVGALLVVVVLFGRASEDGDGVDGPGAGQFGEGGGVDGPGADEYGEGDGVDGPGAGQFGDRDGVDGHDDPDR